jgi:hypothetical protein
VANVTVLHPVRHIVKAFSGLKVLPIFERSGADLLDDRLRGHTGLPAQQLARFMDNSALPVQGDRAKKVVLHVLLAGPQQLDWRSAHFTGDEHRLADEVLRGAAPPVAAA